MATKRNPNQSSSLPARILSERKRVLLLVIIIGVIVGGVYAYDVAQKLETVSFLKRLGAYDPYYSYERIAVIDVDSLPRTGSNITFRNLIVAFTFNPPDEFDNVAYLRITYVSGPPCSVSGQPSSVNCKQMLVIIPNNNVSNRVEVLRAGPRNTFGLDLYTNSGQHIEWRLFLFLASLV